MFIGNIVDKFQTMPALVVVPNSTITNWVREFEKWAPELSVVPFYGKPKHREVVNKWHETHLEIDMGAKFHVLVATYALINPKDFTSGIQESTAMGGQFDFYFYLNDIPSTYIRLPRFWS